METCHISFQAGQQDVMAYVHQIEKFLRNLRCSTESVGKLALVSEEILTNIVRHAWKGRCDGWCDVTISAEQVTGGTRVSLRTEDDGPEFDPFAAQMPDIDAPLEERPIGGLGIYLVKNFTDTQNHQYRHKRNIVTVTMFCPTDAD